MKKSFLLSVLFVVLLCCLPGINRTYAQVYVSASLTDQFLVNSAQWLNSADIDYTPNCSGGGCGNAQLKVVSWQNSTSGAGFIADDGFGSPVTVSLPASASATDVVVGNNTTTSTNYLVGIVYISSGGIFLDIYDISNVGTGSALSSSFVGTYTISSSSAATSSFPRIDIIADYATPFLGFPLCDKFVITYTIGGMVMGYASSLNNPTVSTSMAITPPCSFFSPDVAGIRRYHMGGPAIDDIALFTFFDPGSGYLYYAEWNITSTAVSMTLLDNASNIGTMPKIAALDDYQINNPGFNGLPYYTVVARSVSSAPGAIRIYNNRIPLNGLDVSTPFLGSGPIVGLPAIAVGPCQRYTIAFPTSFGGPDVLALNINWGDGYPLNYYPLGTFSNVDYYEVNASAANNPNGLITVTGTDNTPGISAPAHTLFAWNENSTADVYYKFTDCNMLLKGAHPTSDPVVTKNEQWILNPNPAANAVVLSAHDVNKGDSYTITDVTGRAISTAGVTATTQSIDISNMAAGVYLLNVYRDGQKVKTIKFVKD